MKLCADILYWRLKEKLTTVSQRGKGGSALTLNRSKRSTLLGSEGFFLVSGEISIG